MQNDDWIIVAFMVAIVGWWAWHEQVPSPLPQIVIQKETVIQKEYIPQLVIQKEYIPQPPVAPPMVGGGYNMTPVCTYNTWTMMATASMTPAMVCLNNGSRYTTGATPN